MLIAASLMLAVSVVFLMTRVAGHQPAPSSTVDTAALRASRAPLDSLRKRAKLLSDESPKAKPRFDILFGQMTLDEYRNRVEMRQGDSSWMGGGRYAVAATDVTTRLSSPAAITPDYSHARSRDVFLDEFVPVARKHRMKLRLPFVFFLRAQQLGKGRADSVSLVADRSEIRDVVEIYDAQDLTGAFEGRSKLREHSAKLTRMSLTLGTMDTGSGVVVPLLITNLFDRTDGGNDPSGWEVADGVGYVPVLLRFRNADGTRDSLSLLAALRRPIIMGSIP